MVKYELTYLDGWGRPYSLGTYPEKAIVELKDTEIIRDQLETLIDNYDLPNLGTYDYGPDPEYVYYQSLDQTYGDYGLIINKNSRAIKRG